MLKYVLAVSYGRKLHSYEVKSKPWPEIHHCCSVIGHKTWNSLWENVRLKIQRGGCTGRGESRQRGRR